MIPVFILSVLESWVEVTGQLTPERTTPLPFATGEEYLRLLREAQRESNQSSARVSRASSRRDSPHSRLVFFPAVYSY